MIQKRSVRQFAFGVYLLAATGITAAYPVLYNWVQERRARTFQSQYYWLIWLFLAVYAVLMGLEGTVRRCMGLSGREAFLPRMAAAAAAVLLLLLGIYQLWGAQFQYLLVFLLFLLTKAAAGGRRPADCREVRRNGELESLFPKKSAIK